MKLTLSPGGNVRRAGVALTRAVAAGQFKAQGLVWRDTQMYESEVATLQRVLADVPLCGGAWLALPPKSGGPAAPPHETVTPQKAPRAPLSASLHSPSAPGAAPGAGGVAAMRGGAAAAPSLPSASPQLPRQISGGFTLVDPGPTRLSSCDIEAIAEWTAVACLSPDATQVLRSACGTAKALSCWACWGTWVSRCYGGTIRAHL